jgi:hypothetical protein
MVRGNGIVHVGVAVSAMGAAASLPVRSRCARVAKIIHQRVGAGRRLDHTLRSAFHIASAIRERSFDEPGQSVRTSELQSPAMRVGGPGIRRLTQVCVLAAGAGVWSIPFVVRLQNVNDRWWMTRDDGVITLSHARNLLKFGTIGVSPGGDRVEGFSSPLHFAVGTLVQLVRIDDLRSISMVILAISLVASGLCLTFGFDSLIQKRFAEQDHFKNQIITIVVVGITALATSMLWTTTGWLGSSMENPLILASMAAVIGAALADVSTRPARVVAVLGLCGLMLARVEFAAFAIPVVVAVAAASAAGTDRRRRRRRIALVAAIPLTCAVTLHLARRWYFGAWLPNTAIVQDRSAGTEQLAAIAAISLAVILPVVSRYVARFVNDAQIRGPVSTVAPTVGGGLVIGIAWLGATGRLSGEIDAVLLVPGLLAYTAVVAVAHAARQAIGGRATEKNSSTDRDLVLLSLAALPVSQFLVTGPARLDDYRVIGLAVPVLVVWSMVAVVDFWATFRAQNNGTRSKASARIASGALVATIGVTSGAFAWSFASDPARALPYEIAWADRVSEAATDIRLEHLDGVGMAITASPDLGKLSFAKQSVIVDLGWLGDPLLAILRRDRPDLMDAYLLHVAVPDVVESHSGWSCLYRGWLEAPQFVSEYRLVSDVDREWTRPSDRCPLDGEFGIWTRVLDNGEYDLTVKIVQADDPSAVVADALAECVTTAGTDFRCQHVRRSVQRVAHELRRNSTFGAVLAQFDLSPTASFDHAMLDRGPGWWERAVHAITPPLEQLD